MVGFCENIRPQAKYTPSGYELAFPKSFGAGGINFKDDLVRHHKGLGDRVFYIGDGIGDFPAAKVADFPFAIKDSKLAEACRRANIAHREMTDFQEVVDAIEDLKD